MLRGCILSLALWAALIGGYWYWFDQTFEPPGSIIGACAVGFIVLCCIGALTNARTAWRDWSGAARARHGERLVHGQLVTVCGEIHPTGAPLIAPFSHAKCVLCEYDLAGARRVAGSENDENSGSDYAGFLMVPCVIRGPLGPVRLLGFPIVEGFGESRCRADEAVRNAREFIETHEFEDRSGMKFVTVLGAFGDVWTDDDGMVEKNMRLSKATLEDLFPPNMPARDSSNDESDEDDDDFDEDDDFDDPVPRNGREIPKLVEKRVAVGEQVAAIGIYDEMRGGLVPPGRSGPPNRLLRGTTEQIESSSRNKVVSYLIGGLIGLVVVHAAILFVMWAYRRSPDVRREQEQKAVQAARKADLATLANVVRRGVDVNFRDSDHHTLLMVVEEPATVAWLLKHGADVNAADNSGQTALAFAARHGRTEIVKLLLAAGADRATVSRNTGQTPLEEASSRGHFDVVELLSAPDVKAEREE